MHFPPSNPKTGYGSVGKLLQSGSVLRGLGPSRSLDSGATHIQFIAFST